MPLTATEKRSIFLNAIFPSIHPDVAVDVVATTNSTAHAVRRAHRIAFPLTRIGRERKERQPEDLQRLQHDHLRHTVVHGIQIVDVSHSHEYSDTVVPWVVDTSAWDQEAAQAAARALTQGFDASTVPPEASPSNPQQGRVLACNPLPLAKTGCCVTGSPPPLWLPADDGCCGCPLVGLRAFDCASWPRAVAPLDAFRDVFCAADHKCSLARELFLEGHSTFRQRWDAAAAQLFHGIGCMITSMELVPPSTHAMEVNIPTVGRCTLEHGELRASLCVIDAACTSVTTCIHKQQHQSHEPTVEMSSASTGGVVQETLCIRSKHIKVRLEPLEVVYAPVKHPAKIRREMVQCTVKNVKLKLRGDVLLAPSGRHTIVVEDAKIRLGSLSITTTSMGYNALLWVLTPVLKRILEREIPLALVGKRSL